MDIQSQDYDIQLGKDVVKNSASDLRNDGGGDPAPDFVTILTSTEDALAVKRWHLGPDLMPQCDDYGRGKWWSVRTVPVAGLTDLKHIIDSLDPRSFLIPGKLIGGGNADRRRRRYQWHGNEPPDFEYASHQWFPVDADSIPAVDANGEFDPLADPERAVACVKRLLPPEFADAGCIWQWTGSAGMKPGIRMRLFFWLDRPLGIAVMERWAETFPGEIDCSVYRTVQPIYCARPIFDGIADPITGPRTGIAGEAWFSVAAPTFDAIAPPRTGGHDSDEIQCGDFVAVDEDDPHLDQVEEINAATAIINDDLETWGAPVVGQHSDNRSIVIANKLLDLSLSRHAVAELLYEHWSPNFEPDYLKTKVASAARSRQEPRGFRSAVYRWGDPKEAVEFVAKYLAEHAAVEIEPPRSDLEREIAKWTIRWPEKDANRPPLTYWDEQRAGKEHGMMPRVPDEGCTIIVYGRRTTHKTGVVMKECLDAVLRRNAKVLYLAAEGAHGIRTARLRAACRQRGVELKDLDGRWATFAMTPGLMNTAEIEGLIEAMRRQSFNPDIVVIDTLTRALKGEDINSPTVGSGLIMGMDQIAQAFGGGATVLAVTHPGKDEGKGSIGSSLIESLAFALWHVTRSGDAVFVEVEKMKDGGPQDFTVPFKVVPGDNGVPIVTEVAAGEMLPTGPQGERLVTEARVLLALRIAGAYGKNAGLSDSELAAAMAGPEPADVGERQEWVTRRDKTREGVRSARSQREWAQPLCQKHARPGASKSDWFWFLPENERPTSGEAWAEPVDENTPF